MTPVWSRCNCTKFAEKVFERIWNASPSWIFTLSRSIVHNRMFRKAASSLLQHYTQSSRSISTSVHQYIRQAPGTYFFQPNTNNNIQHLVPDLQLKCMSGAWKEDLAGKKWDWLCPKITTSDIGYKQKMVKVMTKTGETVMAIEFDSKYNCPYWGEILVYCYFT